MMINQAVILAGGKGTRLKPYTDNHPKPLYPIWGKPFLHYLFEQLQDAGVKRLHLLLGYCADQIVDDLALNSSLKMEWSYSVSSEETETGERIRLASDNLEEEFLLLYCDNICPVDLQNAYEQFRTGMNLVQMTAYANKDGYTKNNVIIQNGQVVKYDKKRTFLGLNAVDIGYAFVKKEVLSYLPEGNVSFEKAVYSQVVSEGRMGGYLTEHRYYSIGSWERMKLTKEFLRKRKVVFLDRDGTLNVRPPKAEYIESPEDFIWIPGAKKAVKELINKGYEVYLITNQPGIARGKLTEETLKKIHQKMLDDLHEIGADLDGIYICPHGWDDNCDCRKPKPGMLYQAQKEHSLNLRECFLIGDDERDIEAGKAAGLKECFLVSEGHSLWDVAKSL